MPRSFSRENKETPVYDFSSLTRRGSDVADTAPLVVHTASLQPVDDSDMHATSWHSPEFEINTPSTIRGLHCHEPINP